MPDRMEGSGSVHASCVALQGAGILIRGASGSGKSTLALLLLDRATLADMPAALVGDDRIRLTHEGDTVVARSHPVLGDRIEVRGLGLLRVHVAETSVPLRLVVDLVEACPRLPESPRAAVTVLGRALPGITLDRAMLRSGLAPRLVFDALDACPSVARETHRPILMFPREPGP